MKLLLCISALLCTSLSATTFTYSGTVGGQAANATIEATFGTDSLQLVINGMTANPTSIVQALSAVDFTVTGGLTGLLTDVAGQLITIASGGAHANAAGIPAWTQGTGFYTTALGSGSDHTLIGAPNGTDLYSAANGSIAGSGPHNPFVSQTLTLTYSIYGATDTSTLSSLMLQFGGTAALNQVTIETLSINAVDEVPEPGTAVFALIGCGALAISKLRRK